MSDRPHVVGVVGNDIVFDTRIKKVAAASAAAGFRTTILCYTAAGVQRSSKMGDVEVIRVPIEFAAHKKNGRIPALLRPFDGSELAERHAGPRAHLLAKRRAAEARLADPATLGANRWQASVAATWWRLSLRARHDAFRVRRRAHVTFDRVIRRLNRARIRTTLRLFRPFRDPVPNIADYEVAFGPILEELAPDLIHAHDYHMIGIAVNAARNLRASGHPTKVLYDAHEWIDGLSYPRQTLDGWLRIEGANIHHVDAVTGVSPEQIDQIQERYGLAVKPTLVMNAPVTNGLTAPPSDLRTDLGIEGPIIAYHGNIFLERGLSTVIEALTLLPDDVHLGMLAPKGNPLLEDVRALAAELGVDRRVHILDYVPAEHLSRYLASADLAVVPYLHTGNNDIALPNKAFEAVQAGLPLLVSNMRSLSRLVEENRIGEVFVAGDPADLASRASSILSDPGRYRAAITPELERELSWDKQAERLVALYCNLVAGTAPSPIAVSVADITEEADGGLDRFRPTRLAIGPRNMAGQAYAFATAVQARLGVPSVSFSVERPRYRFPVHIQVGEDQWRDPQWQEGQRRLLASGFTHVLAESGTGMLGSLGGGFIDDQLPLLREDGIRVGVILHGSEIRNPERHRQLPHSPYAVDDDFTQSMEQANARLRGHLAGLDIPFFVTTPDLLADIEATWLPVVIEVPVWEQLAPPFRNPVPTVLHLPTRGRLKGSEYIDPVLQRMHEEGRVRYLRPSQSASGVVPELIEEADIVVDQIVIGAYGLMSVQAMAAGRIAIANVRDLGFLRPDCPVVDANPDTLEATLDALLADRSGWPDLAESGRKYVSMHHDGVATAEALRPFLNIS